MYNSRIKRMASKLATTCTGDVAPAADPKKTTGHLISSKHVLPQLMLAQSGRAQAPCVDHLSVFIFTTNALPRMNLQGVCYTLAIPLCLSSYPQRSLWRMCFSLECLKASPLHVLACFCVTDLPACLCMFGVVVSDGSLLGGLRRGAVQLKGLGDSLSRLFHSPTFLVSVRTYSAFSFCCDVTKFPFMVLSPLFSLHRYVLFQ